MIASITINTAAATLCAAQPGVGSLDIAAQFLGRLHPLTVHFPIALLTVAAGAEILRTLRRLPGPSSVALVCLAVGAIGAGVAAGFGWLNAGYEYIGSESTTLWIHRWLGVGTATLAVVMLCASGWVSRRPRATAAYRAGVIATGLAVAAVGHFGGMLTHGEGYITDAVIALWKQPEAPSRSRPREPSDAMPAPAFTGTVDFVAQVRPILDQSCISCHGPRKQRGGLRLDSADAMARGGKSGPAIIPGDGRGSLLIHRTLGEGGEDQMPLDEDPLPDEQIDILIKWIDEGAHWTDEPGAAGAAPPTHEQVHWSYVPPGRPALPRTANGSWGRNPIDAFILERFARRGLSPSPEADAATLIRRVSLDLTGLPPTITEVDEFLSDARDSAYERLVDRLLASPRYGEHMARPWLDLARYADSSGYEKDGPRTVWPWRDWVIDALNADMPFDRFTIEQVAGDLLPEPTQAQIIATGFHRNTMINEEGGTDPEEFRTAAVIDRASTTATIWLGATLGCAQCHDHKFDPFTQKEFYGFLAFFNNDAEESRQGEGEFYVEISPKLRMTDPRDADLIREVEALEARITPDLPAEIATPLYARADALRLQLHPDVHTLIMRRAETPRITTVSIRGDFRNPGEAVEPGVPAVFPPMPGPGGRDALARWLVTEAGPISARVAMNRMWEQHFGRGLVETTDDFGSRGAEPTHPELLDWLATEFIRSGWSQKAMHRLIVTSAAYRQSSNLTPELLEADPKNLWLARAPRLRLDAETIRDQALEAGGILSPVMGGPSVFPPQPEGVWSSPYSDNRWMTSEGEDRRRRSIYTYWKRSSPYPSFMTFDAPSRAVSCTRRDRSNTPLQALTTLNDPVYIEAAVGLASRAVGAAVDPAGRAAFCFRACLAREPDGDELARVVALHGQQAANFSADPGAAHELLSSALGGGVAAGDEIELASWTIVANVLMNLDEFVTRP